MWAFYMAGEGRNQRGQYFFYLFNRVFYRGVLVNLHLVEITMFDAHTAEINFNMIVKFMNARFDGWRAQLIRFLFGRKKP